MTLSPPRLALAILLAAIGTASLDLSPKKLQQLQKQAKLSRQKRLNDRKKIWDPVVRERALRLNLTRNDEPYPCGACPAVPTRAVVVQHACGGSTWVGDLLDAERCSSGFRHGGVHRDGAFREEPADAVLYLYGHAGRARSSGIMVMTRLLKGFVDELVTQALPPKAVGGVVVQLRNPLFVAICEHKKAEYQAWSHRKKKTGWQNPCDPNHPVAAHCAALMAFEVEVRRGS